MNGLIQQLTNIFIGVLIFILVAVAIGGIGIFYYLRVRQKRRAKPKNVDYSDFNRKDAKDYINNFENIKDDMIILEDGFRYVGVIDCQGFDFYSAHIIEQGNTVSNYISFINTINKPISYRQYCKSVDLDNTLDMYLEAYEKVNTKLEKAVLRLNEMETALKKEPDMEQSMKDLYVTEIERTTNEINAYNFRKFHIEDQMRFIKENSGVSASPLISSTYVFDWTYNPNEFSVDLTEDEILERAKAELEAIANSKIHALAMAGVKARRCTTVELIDMYRRHSQPISAERYKITDILDSSYFDDITTTDCIKRVEEVVKEVEKEEAQEEALNTLKEDLLQVSPSDPDNKIIITAGGQKGDEINVTSVEKETD